MRFVSQYREPPQNFWEVSVEDKEGVIYQARVQENTSVHFLAEFIVHADTDEGRPAEVERLVRSFVDVDPARWLVRDDEARECFVNFVGGLVQFLERGEGDELRQKYDGIYRRLKSFLYEFRANREYRRGWFRFALAGEDLIYDEYKPGVEDEKGISDKIFLKSLGEEYRDESRRENVIRIIEHYKDFRDSLPREDTFSLQSFVNFSKALIQFLERESTGLGVHASLIPEIAAFIVKNEEEDFEEQKAYLERIFASRKDIEAKEILLHDIVADIEQDHGADSPMMIRIVSLISEYYLSIYDLDKSAEFWEKTGKKKDPVFRVMVSLHRSVRIPLILATGFLGLLAGVSFVNTSSTPQFLAPVKPLFLKLAVGLLVALYGLAAAGILTIGYKALKKELLYSQLFLPRLLGASIVGLTPLLLDNLPWEIGILSSGVNLILICLLVYLASFAYIFIEVYNTSKFAKGKTIEFAVKASTRLYGIALVETLFIVIIMSTLFYPVIDTVDLAKSYWGIIIPREGNWLSLGFFPSLTLLWTGISLFVGSFVQLMWQEKRITAPL